MTRRILVPFGASWRYWHEDGLQPAGWTAAAFGDASWFSGAAPLGYSTGESGTRIFPGTSFKRRPIAALFRHRFNLEDADTLKSSRLTLAVHRNTAMRVFVNETAVAWDGVATLAHGNDASAGAFTNSDTSRFPAQFTVPGRLLKNAENVIAVELRHARREYGSLTFDLAFATGDEPIDRTEFAAAVASPVPRAIGVGALAPDFEWLEVHTKKARRISEFFGEPFLLQFSGAECFPCWKKLPIIRRWSDAGLACLSISSWGTIDDVAPPASRHAELLNGIAVGAEPKAYDPYQTACYQDYGMFNGSILVGADGRVLAVASGFAIDEFIKEVETVDGLLRALGLSFPEAPKHVRVIGGNDDWQVVTSPGPEPAGIGSSQH